jgi:hypothetical protein
MTVTAEPAAPPTITSAADVTASDAAAGAGPGQLVLRSLERLAAALVDRAAGAAVDKVDDLAGRLEGIAANGGVGLAAAFGAGTAMMAGKNPVIGAMKGAWGALGTGTKVAIVLGLVLLGLLSPVALVLVLLGLLIAAIVKAAKT